MYKIQNNESGFSAIEILLVVITLAVIGGAGYFVAKHINKTSIPTVVSSSSVTKSSSTSVSTTTKAFQLPSGWAWYTNTQYAFKVAYPDTWGQPTLSITKGDTSGTDFNISFSPGPAYSGVVSRNQMSVIFDSDDYSTPGEKGGTETSLTSKAFIQSDLDAIASGNWQGGPILAHDSTGFVWLTAETSTNVLQVYKMISIPKLDVSGATDTYQIYDTPTNCSTTALSDNSQQWCMNQNVLDELNNILASIQST